MGTEALSLTTHHLALVVVLINFLLHNETHLLHFGMLIKQVYLLRLRQNYVNYDELRLSLAFSNIATRLLIVDLGKLSRLAAAENP